MSLINQMLRDLDARQAGDGARTGLPGEVRPLPPATPSRAPWLVAALCGVVVAGVVVGYGSWFEPAAVPVAVPRAVQPTAAPPAPAPEVAITPVEPPPEVASVMQEPTSSLRLSDILSSPAAKAGSADKPAREAKKDAPRPAETPAPAPVAESRPAKPASIEKTESVAGPRERIDAAYRKAVAAVNQGRVNEAIETLHDVLRQDGLHVAARQLLLRLLLEARRTDEAMQVLRDGLREQPAQTAWAVSLARLQVDRGGLEAAAQTLQQSLPAAMNNPDYLGFTAHLQQRLGRHKDAGVLYETAARLAPADGRWWLGLGLAMEAEGRNDRALAAFQRARECGNLSRELATLVEQKLRQ